MFCSCFIRVCGLLIGGLWAVFKVLTQDKGGNTRESWLHIPGQVGHLFQSKLATHSDVKLAACSGAMLATFSDIPEWVAKMSPE